MPKTVGVLGGGQLGRMLALAGYPLGLRFHFYDPDPVAPAGHLAEHTAAKYNDVEALKHFASHVDVLTYEFENVSLDAANQLRSIRPLYPPAEALEVSQDRFTEKMFLQRCCIPTALFAPVDPQSDASALTAAALTGFPAVLKTRRMGYDGKGQWVVHSRDELLAAAAQPCDCGYILEQFVRFEREVSLISVRALSGITRFYPLIENVHRAGILRTSRAPAPGLKQHLQDDAQRHATALMDALNYAGTLTIEYFVMDGQLAANEIAPRVHNSGHWTIEGAETSQFENHLRGILGLPLGSCAPIGFAGMVNIIGSEPDAEAVLSVPGAHLHLYGKAPRESRKLGHITVRADTDEQLIAALDRLAFVR